MADELQAPRKPAKVTVEGVQAVALTKTVTAMRGICNERLKIDVEYGLKRGTTDNSYLIKVCSIKSCRGALIINTGDRETGPLKLRTL